MATSIGGHGAKTVGTIQRLQREVPRYFRRKRSLKSIRAVFVAEQTMKFEQFEVPDAPAKSEVVVKTERTVVSAGTELANYTGLDEKVRVPGAWCCYPWNPGYGGVGRVVAAGPDAARRFKAGDRVYGFFHHAAHELVKTDTALLMSVPDGLDPTRAVMARMASIAITSYRRARVALGDTVAIVGLGLVGNLAGQYFARAGQTVVGIDLVADRCRLAERVGFAHTLDPSGKTPDDLAREITRLTGSRPSLVVDAVGNSAIVELCVQLVAENGQVSMLGSPRGPHVKNMTGFLFDIHERGIELVGALEWTYPTLKRSSPGVSVEANTELIFRMIESGALIVDPLRSHVLAPSRLDSAYQGLLNRKNEYMGVVIDWENNPPPAVS